MKLFIFAIALFAIILSNSAETDVCLREPHNDNPIRCYGHVPAFYYDHKKDECVSFIYGGCNTSGNLFLTKDACEMRCKRADLHEDVCQLEPFIGTGNICHGNFPSFYYDHKKDKCVSFIYGGCNSSGNKFETKHECETRCKRADVFVDVCQLEPFVGDGNVCRAHLPAFYYDSRIGKCVSFVYGGCNTSGNIFKTKMECKRTCKY